MLLVRYVQNLLQNLGPLQVVGPALLGRASAVKDGEALVGLQHLLFPILGGGGHLSLQGGQLLLHVGELLGLGVQGGPTGP